MTDGTREPSIILHPEKGVNPRMTTCVRCGEDGQELVLLGANDTVISCLSCNLQHYGHTRLRACANCSSTNLQRRRLGDHEKIPSGLCKKCEDEIAEHQEIVKAGGIFWRCPDCRSEGVIKAESEMSKNVREHMGIQPPDPCGIEFSKDQCPVCTKTNEVGEKADDN